MSKTPTRIQMINVAVCGRTAAATTYVSHESPKWPTGQSIDRRVDASARLPAACVATFGRPARVATWRPFAATRPKRNCRKNVGRWRAIGSIYRFNETTERLRVWSLAADVSFGLVTRAGHQFGGGQLARLKRPKIKDKRSKVTRQQADSCAIDRFRERAIVQLLKLRDEHEQTRKTATAAPSGKKSQSWASNEDDPCDVNDEECIVWE